MVLLGALLPYVVLPHEPQLSRELMQEQIAQLRRGEIHCLSQPDPRFVDELLADPVAAAQVHELYLGGDVSDVRLARLRELPNLKSVILLVAEHADVFLERLQALPSLEVLDLERTPLAPEGIAALRRFPMLKSLTLMLYFDRIGDAEGLRGHPTLEHLTLTRSACDPRLVPILQSLPRLQSVSIDDHGPADYRVFEKMMLAVLPNCRCSVYSESY
jgi:hypothetical protein